MKVWKSGLYSVGGQILYVIVTIGTLAILGRLLTPKEFGLFGLLMAVNSIVVVMLDMGLAPAYLKLENADRKANNTFFTISIVMGIISSLLLMIIAPVVADVYDQSELKPLFMVFAISVFFTAVSAQPQTLLTRAKKFDTIVQIRLVVTLLGSISVVIFAFLHQGVWSLVYRAIFEASMCAFLFMIFSKSKYHLVSIKTILEFGKSLKFGLEIVVSRLTIGISQSIDRMIIGKFADISAVGEYTRALQLASMPDGIIRTSLTTPALSYLARISGKARLDHYVILAWIIVLTAGFLSFVLIVEADLIMPLVMGVQWVDAGVLLQWLGLWGVGKIYHGLGAIYFINEQIVKKWILINVCGIVFTYAFPILIFAYNQSLFSFVVSYSVIYCFYWVSIFIWRLLVDYDVSRLVLKMFYNQLMLGIVTVIFGFAIKTYLLNISSMPSSNAIRIVFIAGAMLVIMLILFFILAKEEVNQIKLYLRRE